MSGQREGVRLKERLAQGDVLLGTFVKTASPTVVEVLARTGLDCLCLDAEHAPFDRAGLDLCLLAARAGGMSALVRVPSAAPEHLLNALDCGATGVLVPHVRSAAEAEAVVRAAHYGAGGRGYAGSSRAAGYTLVPMPEHLRRSAETTMVVAQIEDPEAVENVEEIARVPGLDALFVGPADLTVGYGLTGQDDPRLLAAVERVCAAGRQAGRPVGIFAAKPTDLPRWRALGVTLFLVGSDHGFLLAGAEALVRQGKQA